ncbi:hypothetical protein L1887_28895 [Cichorium endivia]|nr:hypothetical protein L1887_28895 [Cichorium endivia]
MTDYEGGVVLSSSFIKLICLVLLEVCFRLTITYMIHVLFTLVAVVLQKPTGLDAVMLLCWNPNNNYI